MSLLEPHTLRENFDLIGSGIAGALLVGATGSVHCAVMCGPLACVGIRPDASRSARVSSATAWHLGRIMAYAAAGLILGTFGSLATGVAREAHKVLPWLMVVGLLISAIDLTRFIKPSTRLASLAGAMMRRASAWSPMRRGFTLGALTPLLPCGLLYGMFLAAAATGSPLWGMTLAAVFALGAIPALAGVQVQAALFSWPPQVTRVLRVVVPVGAAVLVAWRAWQGEAHCCH